LQKRYVHVTLGHFFPELTEEERLYGWFQQDSATGTLKEVPLDGFITRIAYRGFMQSK
jgi:hypothetical protein